MIHLMVGRVSEFKVYAQLGYNVVVVGVKPFGHFHSRQRGISMGHGEIKALKSLATFSRLTTKLLPSQNDLRENLSSLLGPIREYLTTWEANSFKLESLLLSLTKRCYKAQRDSNTDIFVLLWDVASKE
eukprot:Gb_17931 [translate_table: standard]